MANKLTPEELQAKLTEQESLVIRITADNESLQAQLNELTAANKALGIQVRDLTVENDTLSEEAAGVSDLKEQLNAAGVFQAQLQKENAELKQAAKSPVNQERKTAAVPDQTFSVDGKEYFFKVPKFRHGGNIMTATDALTDKKLLAHLVNINSGLIEAS